MAKTNCTCLPRSSLSRRALAEGSTPADCTRSRHYHAAPYPEQPSRARALLRFPLLRASAAAAAASTEVAQRLL
ncbi:hypothetical protein EJB05_39042, partial [Eragrostis curvula]